MRVPSRTVDRRHALVGAGALAAIVLAGPAAAEGADEASLAKAVEAFRVAMQKADRAAFEKLSSANLSYGHSAGRVENKAEFIAASTNGKTSWTSIAFNDRKLAVAGKNGIARFMLVGQTLSEGKTTDINIGVLMVWNREGGEWKLLARQAFRV